MIQDPIYTLRFVCFQKLSSLTIPIRFSTLIFVWKRQNTINLVQLEHWNLSQINGAAYSSNRTGFVLDKEKHIDVIWRSYSVLFVDLVVSTEKLCEMILTYCFWYCRVQHCLGIKFITFSDRTAELMFEKYKVPALFLAKNAVCSSFHLLGSWFSTPVDKLLFPNLLSSFPSLKSLESLNGYKSPCIPGSHIVCIRKGYLFSCW